MKGMASAKEGRACPPNGRYPFNITAAQADTTNIKNEGQANQKGGEACISLSLEIAEGEFAGYPAFDTLGTDGGTNFGGMSKKRLRALEVPGLDSDAEIPDEIIASSLLNRRVFAEVEREPQSKKNDATGKWDPVMDIDEKSSVKTPRYRLKIIGYLRQPAAGQLAAPPQQQGQQQQYAQAPGQQLPQGYPTQLPQAGGFPGAPQFPGAQQGGFPGAPQFAPPGAPQYAQQPQYAQAPGMMPPGAPGGFPQAVAPPAWTQQQGAPNGALPQQGQQAGFPPGTQPGLPGMPPRT